MKNAIFTCSDANCGDFLINHWLKSLKDNIDLSNIDVVIIDYGLTRKQVSQLKDVGVIVYKCVKDGFPNSIKFRDINNFLSSHKYDQVLTCDGGDIIFQEDINHIFLKNNSEFRAVCEEVHFPYEKFFVNGCFSKENVKKIKRMIKGKKMINMGILVAPYGLFKLLCDEFNNLNKFKIWMADQMAVNYIFYKHGFKQLDEKYNFVIGSTKSDFFIKGGVFYKNNGEKINVVHHTGNSNVIFRRIENFGYGRKNKLKKSNLHGWKMFSKAVAHIFET
jgi:hypothetical protein